MWNVNAARPCLVSSVRLFSAAAHALERKAGGNWQQLAMTLEEAEKTVTWELLPSLPWGAPSAVGMLGPGWHLCKFQRRWSLEAVLAFLVSATWCSVLWHLSRTEMPCSCQKPDSSPVRFVLLLIVLCQHTDSIHHVALHSGWVYWNDLWEYRGFSSFCMRVPKLYVVPWHVAGTRWPCLHPYLLE